MLDDEQLAKMKRACKKALGGLTGEVFLSASVSYGPGVMLELLLMYSAKKERVTELEGKLEEAEETIDWFRRGEEA